MIQITIENYERYKRIFGQLGYNLQRLATQMGATKSLLETQDERWKDKGGLGKYKETSDLMIELQGWLNEVNVYLTELNVDNFYIDALELPTELKNNTNGTE